MTQEKQSKNKDKVARAQPEVVALSGPLAEVPPVVIKGGSLKALFAEQAFSIDKFEDPTTKQKVRECTHPTGTLRIIRIEIRDNRQTSNDDLLCLYTVPAELDGRVDVIVFAK